MTTVTAVTKISVFRVETQGFRQKPATRYEPRRVDECARGPLMSAIVGRKKQAAGCKRQSVGRGARKLLFAQRNHHRSTGYRIGDHLAAQTEHGLNQICRQNLTGLARVDNRAAAHGHQVARVAGRLV